MEKEPYIAKIVDAYKTGNGNYFCREENESEYDHHLDWPIFVSAEHKELMENLPIFGIIITDYNTKYFNGKSRPTCRVLSYDRTFLERIISEEDNLNNQLSKQIENGKLS